MTIDPLIGQQIYGGFTATRLLGAGGMGAVYLAEDTELGKRIAVKVLLSQFSQHQEVVQRFTNEAKAAARLAHPHIIDIAAAGKLEDGRHFIAMEFLEGSNLGDYLHQWQRLSTEAALEILIQVCSALSLAHQRHIVHRDLKPDNIFITQAPLGVSWPGYGVPFVKLLDFGIAKLGDPKLAGVIKTRTHQVLGTPYYMAPEQARGLTDVDHRADIYSLGVITYKMLTGNVPFKGNSLADIVYHQSHTQPTDPRELVPGLPDVWATTILHSISCEPDNRPTSAHEFAQTLWQANANHLALAQQIAPSFANRVSPADKTRKAPQRTPDVARPNEPTTLGEAVGTAPAITNANAKPSRARWWIMGVLAAGLAVVGATVAALQRSNNTPNKTVDTPEPTAKSATLTPDASSQKQATKPDAKQPDPVNKTQVVITTKPAGGFIAIDDQPKRKSPLTTAVIPGTTIRVRGTLTDHRATEQQVTIPAQHQFSITLALKPRRRRPIRKPPRPKPRPRPRPDPKPYDPNAPAGGF